MPSRIAMLRKMLGGGDPIAYIVYDGFSIDRATGAVNGTLADRDLHRIIGTTPQNTRTVTDTENKVTVSAGALRFAGGKVSASYTDPMLKLGAVARVAGRTLEFNITLPNTTDNWTA